MAKFEDFKFEIKDGVITRLCDDRALLCSELAEKLNINYKIMDFNQEKLC